ncbi:MAG TPA: carboxylesterase family protein [Aquaticitalea sp.]|nr:carboxylesterase family protein [Aquaticitalea sp.]
MKKSLLYLQILIAFTAFSQTKKSTYTYAIKGADTLKMDVYTPNNVRETDSLPVLLWMHGGGFSVGSRDYVDDARLCQYAAKNGYIGISISYRLLRKGTSTGFGCNCPKEDKMEVFKQAVIDYLDAALFVVNNKSHLHADVSKIIAGGSSAGAEGTLNAVFMREFFIENLEKYKDIKFAGIFACAGAMVNAGYVTKDNAIPAVFYHGTDDKLVPYGTASHHYCPPDKPGYLVLDGSKVIVDKYDQLESSYYFNIVNGGGHEISAIPFSELIKVFRFFERTVLNKEIVQTKIIKTKK